MRECVCKCAHVSVCERVDEWVNKCSRTERERETEIGKGRKRGREDMFRQRGHTPVAVIEVWAN